MKVKITNLRALSDTGEIKITPLTVLLGKNSVGKSTFARSFSLMKQSLFINRSEPVLWYSPDLVDFGSFEDSVTKERDEIEFEYSFEQSMEDFESFSNYNFLWSRLSLNNGIYEDVNKEITVRFSIKKNKIDHINIRFLDFNYQIKYDTRYKVESFIINNIPTSLGDLFSRSDFRLGEIIPQIHLKKNSEELSNNFSFGGRSLGLVSLKEIERLFDKIKDGRTNRNTIQNILNKLILGDYTSFEKNFEKTIEGWKTIYQKYLGLKIDERQNFTSKLYSLIGEVYYNSVVDLINDYLSDYFSEVQYIAPIRATAERYYRIQGMLLNEITSQGENVPMILYNLKPSEKKDWKEWTRKNFDGIEFDVRQDSSNLSLILSKSGQVINLADTGFGYSQILPILLYLWRKTKIKRTRYRRTFRGARSNQSLLIIEQPELHLHPALQANLIDSFARIVKNENLDVSILIETHSDAIVNRLGEHIISKRSNINSNDVNLVFFEEDKENNGLAKLKQIKFDERGRISGWPVGFFEAGPIKSFLGDVQNVD
jgi:hypothetical protein